MSFYELKGNYFDGKYERPPLEGPQSVTEFIVRNSPCDLDTELWKLPLDYRPVDRIIESASNGFDFWKKLDIKDRIDFLKKFQERAISKKEEIAKAISLEMGKPYWEALGEAGAVIGKVDVTINDSLPRVQNKTYEEIMPGTTGHLVYKPLGPCLIIGPFNFPCHLANTQILSALITGNSVILKPSEKVCYSAQLLIDCFHEAGFPKGVINMIQGDGEVARRLVKAKEIKGIFFTGSKEVGLKIVGSTHVDFSKLVSLELGGKNPAIIHQDANLDLAIEEMVKGCFLTTGQRCTSTSLIIIHRSLVDEFTNKFHQLAKRVIVDHPLNDSPVPFMGPLVDQKSVDDYLLFMGMAKREGITEIMRGKSLSKKHRGLYVSPSIHFSEKFDHDSHFLTSEIFGPNATIIPYDNIEEAVSIANSTEYGLASCLFSKDKAVFDLCLRDLETGLLNLNRSTCGASPKLPFGGVKNSGNYRPMAVAAIDACVSQLSSLAIDDPKPEGVENIKGIAKV